MNFFWKRIVRKKQIFILFLDIICVILSSFAAYFLIQKLKGQPISHWVRDIRFLRFTLFMVFLYPLTLYVFELYEFRQYFRKLRTLQSLIISGIVSCSIFLIISRVFDIYIHSLYILFVFFFFAAATLFADRFIFHILVIRKEETRINTLFVGTDDLTTKILEETKGITYNMVGILSDSASQIGEYKNGLKIISTGKNLANLVVSKKIKVLVLALDKNLPLPLIKKIYRNKFGYGIEVYRSDDFYEILTNKFPIQHYIKNGNIPFLDIDKFISPFFKNTKRLADFLGSMLLLIVTLPLFLFIAMLIKSSSKGPIFYIQQRLGFQEKPFKFIKFRTMVHGAEKHTGPKWASKNDVRVTTMGKILRKTNLDELPQLINVLRGDMSFIGPRPFREHFVKLIEKDVPFYSLKFSVKPGMTGWAQVNHKCEMDEQTLQDNVERLQYDLYYIRHASLFLDLFIILKTIQKIIHRPSY